MDQDIIQAAEQLMAKPAPKAIPTIIWPHETDRKVRRAQRLPQCRSDLGGYMALVSGLDERYGLTREFLPKTYPLVYRKDASQAFDVSRLGAGMILECSGWISRSTREVLLYRVIGADDHELELQQLTTKDVIALYR